MVWKILELQAGGVVETVKDGGTGMLFNEQTKEALTKAITDFETFDWNYQEIHQHAQQFSEENFKKNMLDFVNLYLK